MNFAMREWKVLQGTSKNMRTLLFTNMTFAFVLPIIEIFVAAYIMRNSHEASKVASYQLAIYTGTPLAFLINGLLLEKLGAKGLYATGMMMSGISLLIMMSSHLITLFDTALSGVLMGLATGLFWANRGLLTLVSTDNGNRNYFYGLEMSFYTISSVIVPAAIGWLIASTAKHQWVSGGANGAYRIVAILACSLAAIASAIISRGEFGPTVQPRFLYFRFHPAWMKMLALATLFGLGQGYLVTAPALLVLMLVGKEGTLGAILAGGGVISAVLLYGLGRMTRPEHRVAVLGIGISLFLLGSLVDTALFNPKGVLIFMVCIVLAKPTLEWAYFPIQMQVIDMVSPVEGRSRYTYIFSHELGLYLGRFIGCSLFLYLAIYVSDVMALRIALPSIAAIQLLALPLAKRLLASKDDMEAEARKAAITFVPAL